MQARALEQVQMYLDSGSLDTDTTTATAANGGINLSLHEEQETETEIPSRSERETLASVVSSIDWTDVADLGNHLQSFISVLLLFSFQV